MHPSAAREWVIAPTCAAIEPTISKLSKRVPDLNFALICTRWGSALAAYGVDVNHGPMLMAMVTALFAESESLIREVTAEQSFKAVIVSTDEDQIIGMPVPHETLGKLMFVIGAPQKSLGAAIVAARATARELSGLTLSNPVLSASA